MPVCHCSHSDRYPGRRKRQAVPAGSPDPGDVSWTGMYARAVFVRLFLPVKADMADVSCKYRTAGRRNSQGEKLPWAEQMAGNRLAAVPAVRIIQNRSDPVFFRVFYAVSGTDQYLPGAGCLMHTCGSPSGVSVKVRFVYNHSNYINFYYPLVCCRNKL